MSRGIYASMILHWNLSLIDCVCCTKLLGGGTSWNDLETDWDSICLPFHIQMLGSVDITMYHIVAERYVMENTVMEEKDTQT